MTDHPTKGETPALRYRVGEFISSARRPEHVLMIAVGSAQIAEYETHRDFVRWIGPAHSWRPGAKNVMLSALTDSETRASMSVAGLPWSPNAETLEKLAGHSGLETDLMRQGAASLVYSFGIAGVSLSDLRRFAEYVYALASRQAAAVPAGMWLAPMEPDYDMTYQGAQGTTLTRATACSIYEDMRDSWLARHPAVPAERAVDEAQTEAYAEGRSDERDECCGAMADVMMRHEEDMARADELLAAAEKQAARWRFLEAEAYQCVIPNGNVLGGKRTAWITKLHPGESFAEAIDAEIAARARVGEGKLP